jgi:tRNA (uracil-5-)-methyltransferase TRM9
MQRPCRACYNDAMDEHTVARLLDLNRQFYQTFAFQFSATRQRLQPGVQRVLAGIDPDARLLDLGCGNGEVARHLVLRGHTGGYVGLDSNPEILQIARDSIAERPGFTLLKRDLAGPGWHVGLPGTAYDTILAFAVLHHIPGDSLRRAVLAGIRALLSLGGRFVHSEWQLLNSARLRSRLQPWSSAGLTREQVDEGDYLVDWREGGAGLRYVHVFTEEELAGLAASAGFEIVESFHSDGEGGRLGLYQTWMGV